MTSFARGLVAAAWLALLTGPCGVAFADPPSPLPGHDAPPAAKLDSGWVSGGLGDGVVSFKGIPFAAPPVGPLRWRPPAPPAPWTGIRDASHYGAICMQKLSKDNGVGPGPASEDCLTLNVFTHEHKAPHRPMAVMVWIHGGGLVNGSATADLYDGAALARQGVVVVTVNYRLGRFGFFAHPALTAEAAGGPVANYGLMDLVAALKWVKRNIAAFGGNPDDVTVFGESAGGMAVNRLMMIDEARGLFRKAIVESGLGREQGHDLGQAEADGVAFAARLAAPGADVAALRAIPAQAIIDAGDPQIFLGQLPIRDGRMLKEDVENAFAAGRVARIPYLVGSNSLELPPAGLGPQREFLLSSLVAERRPAVEAAYGSKAAYEDHVASDIVFGEPARMLARDMARTGAPVFLYRFSVLSAGAPPALAGAPHASDRQYVFQTLGASAWPTDQRDAALATTISAYWVAFAKSGDPNGAGRPKWPAFGPTDELIDFTNAGPRAEVTPDAAALDAIAAARAPSSKP